MLSRYIHNVSPRLDAMLGYPIACVHQYRRNKSAFLARRPLFRFVFSREKRVNWQNVLWVRMRRWWTGENEHGLCCPSKQMQKRIATCHQQ